MAATYRLTVETGTADPTVGTFGGAGTEANVFITLYGTGGNSGERLLDNAQDNFERGKTDLFSLDMRDIGQITKVRIRHDNTGLAPGWFLNEILVHNEDTGQE